MDKRGAEVKEQPVAKDDPDRERRLAEALRQNLRRRKGQARAAAAEPAGQEPVDRKAD
jgi:hypothetical protein